LYFVSDCLTDHTYRDKKVVSVFVRFSCAAGSGILTMFAAKALFLIPVIQRPIVIDVRTKPREILA
jgi:hypothetical protein